MVQPSNENESNVTCSKRIQQEVEENQEDGLKESQNPLAPQHHSLPSDRKHSIKKANHWQVLQT
jgi:hypothetical protein